jgi:hypothetical protein
MAPQIDGFDPFDSLAAHGRTALTQEMLTWHHIAVMQRSSAENNVAAFATALMTGWWETAMMNEAFYYALATNVIRVQEKVTQRAQHERQCVLRSIVLRLLSQALAEPERDLPAATLAISMLMDWAVADGESAEARCHAHALGALCPDAIVSNMSAAQWFTVSHASVKFAIWSSTMLPLHDCSHPAFRYSENDFSTSSCEAATVKASVLCKLLPDPRIGPLDCVSIYRIFRQLFIYMLETELSRDDCTGVAIALLYSIQVDLCNLTGALWKNAVNGGFMCKETRAAYCTLAATLLSTYAPFSFSPYSSTVCGLSWSVGVLRKMLDLLQPPVNVLADESILSWYADYGNYEYLIWVIFVGCAYANIADTAGERGAKELKHGFCFLLKRTLNSLNVTKISQMVDTLRLFPWCSSTWKPQSVAVWTSLGSKVA